MLNPKMISALKLIIITEATALAEEYLKEEEVKDNLLALEGGLVPASLEVAFHSMDPEAKHLLVEAEDSSLHLVEGASYSQEEVADSNRLVDSKGPCEEEVNSSSYCSLVEEACSLKLNLDADDSDDRRHRLSHHFLHDDDPRHSHDVPHLMVLDLSFKQRN